MHWNDTSWNCISKSMVLSSKCRFRCLFHLRTVMVWRNLIFPKESYTGEAWTAQRISSQQSSKECEFSGGMWEPSSTGDHHADDPRWFVVEWFWWAELLRIFPVLLWVMWCDPFTLLISRCGASNKLRIRNIPNRYTQQERGDWLNSMMACGRSHF